MAVLVDVLTFSVPSGNGVATATFTNPINVGSGANGTSNMALVVAVCFVAHAGGTSSGVSATWNGVSMTQLSSAANGGDIVLFGLRNPTTGSHNLVVNWTGLNQIEVGMLSVVGVDTTSDATAFPVGHRTSNTGTPSPSTISITNASGNIAFAGYVGVVNFGTSGGGTDIGHNNTGAANSGASNYGTSVNPTLTYTFSGGTVWAAVGCEIAAPGGGGGGFTPKFRSTLSQIGGRVGTRQALRWAGRKLISFFARPAAA